MAGAFGVAQVWPEYGAVRAAVRGGRIGYGHSSAEVAEVRSCPAELLTGYHDAVHAQTVRLVSGVTDGDLSRVVDELWDPPVTLGVRLVSVISDCLQHAGQAAFIRGILLRRLDPAVTLVSGPRPAGRAGGAGHQRRARAADSATARQWSAKPWWPAAAASVTIA